MPVRRDNASVLGPSEHGTGSAAMLLKFCTLVAQVMA
jgi:hypothetical protein